MGKNKLKKFAEMETLPCVHQYPFADLKATGTCPLRGRWNEDVFHNPAPITSNSDAAKANTPSAWDEPTPTATS